MRGARIVLVDDTEARARMTASWLRQMGWDDVFVLAGGIGTRELVSGSRQAKLLGIDRVTSPTMSPRELESQLAGGRAVLIDIADPRRFRTSHIAGAWYAVRSKLPSGLDRLDKAALLAFTSSDGRIAKLVADEIATATKRATIALEGGTAAWKAAGLPMVSGEVRSLHPIVVPWSPYQPENRTQKAMLDYLSWEVDLYDRIKRDEEVKFRALPPRR